MWGDSSCVDNVCLNDWGSARPPGVISSTAGTNPVYRCPEMGNHFELGGSSFHYTAISDLRALFLSLLAFSLKPRLHGDEELPGILPWERKTADMQAVKSQHLSERQDTLFWNPQVYRPEAARLLRDLRYQLFRRDPLPALSELYDAFMKLGAVPSIPEHVDAQQSSAVLTAAPASAASVASVDTSPSASSLSISPSSSMPSNSACCQCGRRSQSDSVCKGNSNCGCVRQGRMCSANCFCGQRPGTKQCTNPHGASPSSL